jgi:prepilin-type N-terminal cleavage/methylation domain-containing protein
MIMMNNRKAFTIVELLIVVTIIALLLGILLPSIAMVRAKAKETAQKAQFATIEMALEAFKQDYGDYPPSDLSGTTTQTYYCGAQKLSEALLGWDLMGFNPNSNWQALDSVANSGAYDSTPANLQARKGPYLELAKANAFRLYRDLFNNNDSSIPATFVLCDVYRVRKLTDPNTGKTITVGSPILYYKANTANKTIDMTVTITDRTYNYNNNWPITSSLKLTTNGPGGLKHPFDSPSSGTEYPVFYSDKATYDATTYGGSGIGYGIRDTKVPSVARPYNPDTYILISAGPDGYYGTADDIHNY